MFIYNLKVNGSKIFKIFLLFVIILIILITVIVTFKLFDGASKISSTCISADQVAKITPNNYTNILKMVHDNIDTYVGQKINFTGYVYRVSDLKDNQFILARDMIISSDFQTVIVGFLCEYDKAKEFEDNSWVEITGKIEKCNYHGDMPIIQIEEIKKIDKPNDEYVYPPDSTYIETNSLI